jgi:protein FAM50
VKKKTKKAATKAKLSFGIDDEDEGEATASAARTPRSLSRTPDIREDEEGEDGDVILPKKKLGARAGLDFVPKARTKAAIQHEAEKTEQLRKEFIATREAVKKTEVVIPFVFYDGAVTPGGKVKVKKGDHIWLFLDKARKMGAELGVGGERASSNWARVSVDDLMMVKDEIILPHVSCSLQASPSSSYTDSLQHYEFYYFPANKTQGYNGPLFNFSAERTTATPTDVTSDEEEINTATYDPLARQKKTKDAVVSTVPDDQLEGFYDDPTPTKLVDRRWFEKHKHIYPASVWQEFDPTKDYSSAKRTDAQGNAFFLS